MKKLTIPKYLSEYIVAGTDANSASRIRARNPEQAISIAFSNGSKKHWEITYFHKECCSYFEEGYIIHSYRVGVKTSCDAFFDSSELVSVFEYLN